MTTVVALGPLYSGHSTRLFVATTVVGLLAADQLYRWVEQPMIAVGRRFSGSAKVVPPLSARRAAVERLRRAGRVLRADAARHASAHEPPGAILAAQ